MAGPQEGMFHCQRRLFESQDNCSTYRMRSFPNGSNKRGGMFLKGRIFGKRYYFNLYLVP